MGVDVVAEPPVAPAIVSTIVDASSSSAAFAVGETARLTEAGQLRQVEEVMAEGVVVVRIFKQYLHKGEEPLVSIPVAELDLWTHKVKKK